MQVAEALEMLRSPAHLPPEARRQAADTLETEIERIKGINSRNVERAKAVQERAKALRDDNSKLHLKVGVLKEEIRQMGKDGGIISEIFDDIFGAKRRV
jgi:chromosome segregation ATPase